MQCGSRCKEINGNIVKICSVGEHSSLLLLAFSVFLPPSRFFPFPSSHLSPTIYKTWYYYLPFKIVVTSSLLSPLLLYTPEGYSLLKTPVISSSLSSLLLRMLFPFHSYFTDTTGSIFIIQGRFYFSEWHLASTEEWDWVPPLRYWTLNTVLLLIRSVKTRTFTTNTH